jgi:non-specific serine/threonine protein kinase
VETHKAIALLCYLAITVESHRRDSLAALFWPERNQAHARATLRKALSALKKALGKVWLEVKGEEVGLKRSDDVRVDVHQFRSLLSECGRHGHTPAEVCPECARLLTEAAGFYRGDFLAGFSLKDSSNFDDWQFSETQNLRSEMSSALERLVLWHSGQRKFEVSIGYARRWLEMDRTNEAAHRGLMELYARTGHKAAALRQYEECAKVIVEELGEPPQEATKELYKAIRENRFATAGLPPGIPSNNLPRQLTSFIGREREIAEIKNLLATVLLLTLTGSGGCGKTRLALKVAEDLMSQFPDGVWFVELAALSDLAFVAQAVAGALGVGERPGSPLVNTLIDHLGSKNVLLVLDNCEHMIDACAALSESLLRSCPNLRILATSRESLGIGGERAWRVPSLSMPDPVRMSPISAGTSDLTQYEAVRLFIDRAAAAGFKATKGNAPTIALICHRLDGIPLAIELAAARAKALSVEQIADHLDDRFRLLTGGGRTAPPRQKTLLATMDWSYGLLSEAERVLFRRLSAFVGEFTLPAAEEVCADGIGRDEILDLLTHLVAKSLVAVKEERGEARYRLLETIRQYARSRLLESGEESVLRGRHRDWFLSLAERAEPELRGPDQGMWLDRLELEHDNLRAALAWSRESGEAEEALRLAGALWWFWYARGYWNEGRTWLEGALSEGSGTSASVRAKALNGAGLLARDQGDYGRAEMLCEESLALFRKLGDKRGIAWSLRNLGFVVWSRGDNERAGMLSEGSLALFREIGDKWGIANSLRILGLVARRQGDYGRAAELGEGSLALSREIGDGWGIARSHSFLGYVAFGRGDYERASMLYRDGLAMSRELKDKWDFDWCLKGLAGVAEAEGQLGQAARLFGAEEALREAIGVLPSPFSKDDYDKSVAAVRAGLGEEKFAAAWEEGRAMTPEQAIATWGQWVKEGASIEPKPTVDSPAPPSVYPAGLTARQVEVLRLVAMGLTTAQVAKKLDLSTYTVNSHLRSIYKKIGITSRTAMTRYAIDHKLI